MLDGFELTAQRRIIDMHNRVVWAAKFKGLNRRFLFFSAANHTSDLRNFKFLRLRHYRIALKLTFKNFFQ
jgi:hypothetical protein